MNIRPLIHFYDKRCFHPDKTYLHASALALSNLSSGITFRVFNYLDRFWISLIFYERTRNNNGD